MNIYIWPKSWRMIIRALWEHVQAELNRQSQCWSWLWMCGMCCLGV